MLLLWISWSTHLAIIVFDICRRPKCVFHITVVCVCVEILEGGVQIIKNEFLSYAPQINWLDIVKDSGAEVIIQDNGPERKRH